MINLKKLNKISMMAQLIELQVECIKKTKMVEVTSDIRNHLECVKYEIIETFIDKYDEKYIYTYDIINTSILQFKSNFKLSGITKIIVDYDDNDNLQKIINELHNLLGNNIKTRKSKNYLIIRRAD